MSDKLVVFYSRKAVTKIAAEKLAEQLNCDITEITAKKKYRGLFGFLAGGRSAMKEKIIEINMPDKSPENYDHVIICSPVWASNMPPAVRTYLNSVKDKLKKHSFLLTFSGGGQEKAIAKMTEITGPPAKIIHFSDFERKSDAWVEKLTAFANEL